MIPFAFDDKKGDIPDTIHMIPIGQWEHDMYGPIIITSADIREYVQNFNQGVRKGVFITAGHEGFEELPAVGWVQSVEARDTGLWGKIEWTPEGIKLLSDKAFKFFSPELCRDFEDPQTHQFYRNVMTGGALTKSPYFKELEAIVFSEKGTKKFSNNNEDTMNLQELLAKDITTLTDEEKAFIKANASELTDEQKASHAAIVEEPAGDEGAAETDEEKATREAKEAGDANEAAGLNRDGSAKADAGAEGEGAGAEKIEASEKDGMVTMSKQHFSILEKKANEGAQAVAELKKAKTANAVEKLVFSSTNKAGKFLPKGKDVLTKFMESMNEGQIAQFSEVLKHLPTTAAFTEIGHENGTESTSQAEVETKVNAKLAANPKMKYSEALKQVMSENKGLEERYDGELSPVGKKA